VDVCIVGGGYTGLWTAIELAEQAPDLRVAIVERAACGFGSSGRNGGWATGWHDELDALIARFGREEGLRLAGRSAWAIDRIEAFAADHGIECGLRRRGAVKAAMQPWQVDRWKPALRACQETGRSARYEEVSGDLIRARTGSPLPIAGIRQTDGASLQPAFLARGLRRAALKLGVQIYEATPMIALDRGRPAVVHTPGGRLRAERVVLATGAWIGEVRELRRATVPVGSHVVATEPLGARVSSLGWADGELLGDCRLMVHYAQVSVDGRIVFGRGGGALGRCGRVIPAHFHDPRAIQEVADDFRRWFPSLAGVRITHGWGGPVDRAPGHLPFVGALGDHDEVLYGAGFSGNGVAPSALIGRTLGRICLAITDEDTRSPLAAGPPAYLPPEPLRSAGGAVLRAVIQHQEQSEERGRRPLGAGVLRRLIATTVPRALDPRMRGGRAAAPADARVAGK
jgi:glycine/D-amino acid oxidase-like deaminating enzyme